MADGTARRLPSWMTAASTDKKTKTAIPNANKESKKQTHNSLSTHSQETRRKLQVLQTDHNPKWKTGTRRKRNGKSLAFSNDDEDDFTVHDLVTIAHEYVKNEEGRVDKRLLKNEVRSQKKISEIGSSRCDIEESVIADHSEQVESGEQCRVQVNRTGDPAQDMLDLFLGPLLKRPPEEEEEKKIERLNNDFDFSRKMIKENRRDPQEEMLVPSKKKSSLKNKVSMLLD